MKFPNTEQFIELKKKYVREALEGGNASFTARKHGLSPKTLAQWVRDYREEVEEEMAKKDQTHTNVQQQDQDLKKQLDQALKVIGKLQVENEILKDLLKKNE